LRTKKEENIMTSIFAITNIADKLKAETGSATTVFTVTNTTSRPLRGVAKIKPLGNSQIGWLKIEGESERDFPAGGTHQFTVNFNKPKPSAPPAAAQPAESFPFRLDVISTTNPDEDFTEGPVVTVEVPAHGSPPKPFPWWILIVLVILLIVGAVITVLLLKNNGNSNPPPPNTSTPTPTPVGIRVVYDFIEKAPNAVWKNDLDRVLAVIGPEESTGFVKVI
jgi:hypothetical protein